MPESGHPLEGSAREALAGATALGPCDPDERLEVSVLVRGRAADALVEHVRRLDRGAAHLTREEFASRFGADPADLDRIRRFAAEHGLSVVQEHEARRTVVLSGTVAGVNEAFGVDLRYHEHDGGTYRGHAGPLHLPDALTGVVDAVLGLDDRAQASPRFRVHGGRRAGRRVRLAGAPTLSYTPLQLASMYRFPAGDGAGQCIALIELGGGYRHADLQAYFAALGAGTPSVVPVSVDHGRNTPTGDPNGPDGEVMLDIEVAGAIAPAATVAVYFAPNTDAGFLDAVTTAVHDTTRRPTVVSISWGGPESAWTRQAMTAMDQAFRDAAAMGVTICVASGDSGSSDGVGDGSDHVDFPASSPHGLACGGTSLRGSRGAITREVAWNDGPGGGATGGGVSDVFATPAWQSGLQVRRADGSTAPLAMRGVPDVAGDADPETGYRVRVDDRDLVIGGTSAVAPLWAGLIARINGASGTAAGWVNARLYGHRAGLRDITRGDNGDFAAGSGWDACTGLGSPDGSELAGIL